MLLLHGHLPIQIQSIAVRPGLRRLRLQFRVSSTLRSASGLAGSEVARRASQRRKAAERIMRPRLAQGAWTDAFARAGCDRPRSRRWRWGCCVPAIGSDGFEGGVGAGQDREVGPVGVGSS